MTAAPDIITIPTNLADEAALAEEVRECYADPLRFVMPTDPTERARIGGQEANPEPSTLGTRRRLAGKSSSTLGT